VPTVHYGFANNRLLHITDTVGNNSFAADLDNQSANNYKYDANGNVIKDVKNGLDTLIYDYRNLPLQIKKNGVTTTYRYDASGHRVSKYTSGVTTYYLNDFSGRTIGVLANNGDPIMMNIWGLDHAGYLAVLWDEEITCTGGGGGGEGTASMSGGDSTLGLDTLVSEGPLSGGGEVPNIGGGGGGGQVCDTVWIRTDTRYYYLKDHLGTIRVTVKQDGTVASYDDYYPYGQGMDGRSMASGGDARYKYIGKERDIESGLDWLESRGYDARIGRFLAIDPMATLGGLRRWSPYHYSNNNPLRFLDPTGMTADDASDERKGQTANKNVADGGQQFQSGGKQISESIVFSTSSGIGYGAEVALAGKKIGANVGFVSEVTTDLAGNKTSSISTGVSGEVTLPLAPGITATGVVSLGGSASSEKSTAVGFTAEAQVNGKGAGMSLTPDGFQATAGNSSVDQGLVISAKAHIETFGLGLSVNLPKLATGIQDYVVGGVKVIYGATLSKMLEFKNLIGHK
jgi:RHS repeat-associated protein